MSEKVASHSDSPSGLTAMHLFHHEKRQVAAVAALVFPACLIVLAVGCASDDGGGNASSADRSPPGQDTFNRSPESDAGTASDTSFVPEDEEFLVREVAATENFVFVPNSSESSNTVARIDGRDLTVKPVQVADKPVAVRAATAQVGGESQEVAWVLCEGASAVSLVRNPDASTPNVSLLSIPDEVNAIRLSPNGKYLLAYIDPDQPLPEESSVASLQSMALLKIGSSPDEDTVHQLSVTPEISEIEFTDDGDDAFVVGRDGINHLALDEISQDAFVPTMDIDLSNSAFPPADREVEVSGDGELVIVRSSAKSGLALFRRSTDGDAPTGLKMIDLPGRPTDIRLTELPDGMGNARRTVVAPIRETEQVAFIDVDAAFEDSPGPASEGSDGGNDDDPAYVELLTVDGVQPGLARLTPDRQTALLFTTLADQPRLGLLDLQQRTLTSYGLRNQIRSVAISPAGDSAVVIHEKQAGSAPAGADPAEFFRHNHGVTLVNLASGYLRPVTLEGEPTDWVMTDNNEGIYSLYAILESEDSGSSSAESRGLLKLSMDSFRRDFFRTARQPNQLGRVADKVFVSQEAEQGRITFVDVNSGQTRTVSGYELNARIQ